MSKALANPKLFAAATLLFAVATFANLSMSSNQQVNPLLSAPTRMRGEELRATPAIPVRIALAASARY